MAFSENRLGKAVVRLSRKMKNAASFSRRHEGKNPICGRAVPNHVGGSIFQVVRPLARVLSQREFSSDFNFAINCPHADE